MRIEDLPEALFAEAVELWQVSGLTRPWNDPESDLRRAARGRASTVLAARDDAGRLLGTAMVGHDGHRGWVYYLAVVSSRRRQGIGRALMRACESWVHQHDVPKIQLMVRRENADVIAFYTGIGYTDGEVVVLARLLP